jgi:hypothetical protein
MRTMQTGHPDLTQQLDDLRRRSASCCLGSLIEADHPNGTAREHYSGWVKTWAAGLLLYFAAEPARLEIRGSNQ